MNPRRPKTPPKPATPALTLLALALLLALPSAWPLDLGKQAPSGLVSGDQLKAAQAEADKLRSALKAAQEKATAAEAAVQKADERARLAAQSKPAGVPPEQLDAVRKDRDAARTERDAARAQRDTALADAEGLQTQLKQAQADLKRGATAAKDDGTLRTERDRLKRDNQAQQERIGVLQADLADKDKALLAARQVQRVAQAPAPAPTQAAPAIAAPAPSAMATPPADGTELTVAGCGAACPSFVLIPNPGATVIGSGAEAITARFNYRFAMAKTEVTLGQYKAFWAAPDRNYQPVKTTDTHCNWDDKEYTKDDRHPVRCVNTLDAQAYARWFAKRYAAQLGARIDSIDLPTELEWEFSARGGRYTQAFLWADDASKAETCRYAKTYNCPGDVLPVAGRLKNDYGLYDMIGNVWEWTATDWREDRKSMEANHRDHGNDSTGVSAARAVRGASIYYDGNSLRLADRYRFTPGFHYDYIGFRLVARIAP